MVKIRSEAKIAWKSDDGRTWLYRAIEVKEKGLEMVVLLHFTSKVLERLFRPETTFEITNFTRVDRKQYLEFGRLISQEVFVISEHTKFLEITE